MAFFFACFWVGLLPPSPSWLSSSSPSGCSPFCCMVQGRGDVAGEEGVDDDQSPPESSRGREDMSLGLSAWGAADSEVSSHSEGVREVCLTSVPPLEDPSPVVSSSSTSMEAEVGRMISSSTSWAVEEVLGTSSSTSEASPGRSLGSSSMLALRGHKAGVRVGPWQQWWGKEAGRVEAEQLGSCHARQPPRGARKCSPCGLVCPASLLLTTGGALPLLQFALAGRVLSKGGLSCRCQRLNSYMQSACRPDRKAIPGQPNCRVGGGQGRGDGLDSLATPAAFLPLCCETVGSAQARPPVAREPCSHGNRKEGGIVMTTETLFTGPAASRDSGALAPGLSSEQDGW